MIANFVASYTCISYLLCVQVKQVTLAYNLKYKSLLVNNSIEFRKRPGINFFNGSTQVIVSCFNKQLKNIYQCCQYQHFCDVNWNIIDASDFFFIVRGRRRRRSQIWWEFFLGCGWSKYKLCSVAILTIFVAYFFQKAVLPLLA